jgi:transcriptional regulator with XRE-family HTH domain
VPSDTKQAAQLKRFGANVRRERARLNLTQEELAEKSDLHPRALQKIEAGDVDACISTVLRIQKALKCKWEVLLGKPWKP